MAELGQGDQAFDLYRLDECVDLYITDSGCYRPRLGPWP